MADNGRWFKLWTEALDDQDLDNLALEDFGRWAKFGAYLKKHGKEGEIILTAPARTLCSMFQLPKFDVLIDTINKFPNVKISPVSGETNATVSFTVKWKNWIKYQGDFSTDRVRKFRAKKQKNETPKKRGEEKRGEENIKENNIKENNNNNHNKKISFNEIKNEFENITNEYWNKWYEVFPALDVQAEIDKAAAWVMSNPTRKKKDWAKFLNNWLVRSQDRAEFRKSKQDFYGGKG